MGRARRGVQASVAATANFNALMGRRRGQAYGNLMATVPKTDDIREYERVLADVRHGETIETMQMFCKHKHEIERLPLLRNLYDHYCQHVTVQTRNRNYQAAAETMKALDFTVSEGGQLFEVMKIQELFDEGLDTQVRTRLANILKASTVDGASLLEREVETKVGDAAYEAEFQKYAGAQSWKERERICRLFLGSDVPSNLSDVSAWRAAVKWMFTDPLLLAGANTYLEKVTSILRTVKPSAAPKTPQARRRQRYVR